jgi:hypothetical protein
MNKYALKVLHRNLNITALFGVMLMGIYNIGEPQPYFGITVLVVGVSLMLDLGSRR